MKTAQNTINASDTVGVGDSVLADMDDPHRSRATCRLVQRAILAGWMKPDEFKELVQKGATLAKNTDDAREYNAAMSPVLSAMKIAQAERLHDKARKVEVDHNHHAAVLVMPTGYVADDTELPEATPDVIETCKAIQDGDSD